MNSLLTRCSFAVILLSLAGCAKKPAAEAPPPLKAASVALVPETERSQHFEAVNGHLELGGTLYAYADLDGDALSLAESAKNLVHQLALAQPNMAPIERQDIKGLFTDLGLTDLKAVGMSSVREAGGNFRNRTFFFTPEGRHGLLAVFGGQPGRFTGVKFAPPDADYYCECEFDVAALYDTVKAVVVRVSGPDAAASFEKKVKDAGAESGYSALDVIEGLNGRIIAVIRMQQGSHFRQSQMLGAAPVELTLPGVDAVVRVDGIGAALEGALEKDDTLIGTVSGSRHLFTKRQPSPMFGMRPVMEVEGKTFYVATSAEFLRECLYRQAGLDTNPRFAAGLAELGPEGNGVTWVTPRFFSTLKGIGSMNPNLAPQIGRSLDSFAANLPTITQPLLSVRSNLPDGILIRSSWNKSLKSDVAMFTIYNPVTIGLIAAMAIPAFEKVRQNAQAKAALSRPPSAAPQLPGNPQTEGMIENLHVLGDAADRYYADHNATATTYDQLVGSDKYVAAIRPVADEDYRTVLFKKGRPLHLFLKDGRAIVYPQQ